MALALHESQVAPVVRIRPPGGRIALELHELWEYRELLYFLVWRDVKVRYKQTVLGVAWAVIQPLMTMMIFTVVFGRLARIPSDGIPYPIFSYTALLPWSYFAQAIGRSGTSLVSSANLIKKIYFPRAVVPIAAAVGPLVDFAVAFLVLTGMMAWYDIVPEWRVLALPAFLLLAVVTALAVGLFLSALNVRYRDVGHVVPFVVQFWMYASPVVYPVSLVPDRWRMFYSLNPMVGVIEGFRWALLGHENVDVRVIITSAFILLGLLLGALFYFKRMEQTFADVV